MNNLSEDIANIFSEIKPRLKAISGKYKVANPEDFIGDWMSSAFIIAKKFDDGDLVKKILIDGEVVLFDSAIHDYSLFRTTFKKYLVTSFVNDVLKQYNYAKRFVEPNRSIGTDGSPNSVVDMSIFKNRSQSQVLSTSFSESANVSDLISIIALDISRLSADCSTILDLTNIKFLESVKSYCSLLVERYGDFQVANDLDASKNRKFFSDDFKEEAEDGIRREICKIILKEDNPIVIQRLGVLINMEQRGTLQKRIFRYFFENKGGIQARLKRKIS